MNGLSVSATNQVCTPSTLAGHAQTPLPWIKVAPGAPYFVTESGKPWTPIGYNDSVAWVDFQPLYARRDVAAVEAHLRYLSQHGVTCIRLMLECAQGLNRYIERPVGQHPPKMVRLWDDLFALCERVGMRILLTPFDTFWTWINWKRHPYNVRNGGVLDRPSRILLDAGARDAIKARLSFAVERWGGSGALFAWDLWNEIHPAQADETADCFADFISDLSSHVASLEVALYGRRHLQTVSLFGPELTWRAHLPLKEPIFRHSALDFATIHIYESGTIDHPRNTVDPARGMGRIVRECLDELTDTRPFLDTEHGPIHTFKDLKKTLPRAFDDEMFRHMAWAHLASGGAGGGMRWPNRRPHVLTAGMRRAQRAMAAFLPLIDWTCFQRRNLNAEVVTAPGARALATFACADGEQALLYLLRRDSLGADGRLNPKARPIAPLVRVPGLRPGRYRITPFDTNDGVTMSEIVVATGDKGGLSFSAPSFAGDRAFAISAIPA